MSEVKRYSFEQYPHESYITEDAEGRYVEYKDYADLKEQFDFKQNLTEQIVELQKQLDELAKQEPYGYVAESPCSSGYGGMMHEFSIDRGDAEHDANQAEGFVIELFTRPAPAVSLAELVPEKYNRDAADYDEDSLPDIMFANGFDACRAAILRNIEEANK